MSGCFSYIVFLACLLAAAPSGAAAEAAHGTHALPPFSVQRPAEARQASAFSLKDMDGRERTFAEFSGRVVLIHFWASWCEPCKQEFPALSALEREFAPKGLAVVAVAGDSRKRVGEFLKENPAAFPILIDQYGSVMRSYSIGAIPASVVVGRDGLVKGVAAGPRDYAGAEAREFFEKILNVNGSAGTMQVPEKSR